MSNAQVSSHLKSAQIEAVVIRADGTREDLGVVAEVTDEKSLADLMRGFVNRIKDSN